MPPETILESLKYTGQESVVHIFHEASVMIKIKIKIRLRLDLNHSTETYRLHW